MQGMETNLKQKISSLEEDHKKDETVNKTVFNKKIAQVSFLRRMIYLLYDEFAHCF